MNTAAKPSLIEELDKTARRAGGRLFALIIATAAIFCLALFNLRADKIFTLPADIAGASHEDLVAFWRAAHLFVENRAAAAYAPEIFRTGLPDNAQGLLFLNPPHFFLLIWPLGLMSYGAAKALWIAVNTAALAGIGALTGGGAARRIGFAAALTLSPAAFASFLAMQVGPLVALCLLAALMCARERPWLAGILLALLTMKPQFGLMAPIFLAARGDWKAFIAASASAALLMTVSAAIVGPGAWTAFFDSLGGPLAAHAAHIHRDMVTMHETAGKLGAGDAVRSLAQLAVIIASAGAVFLAARRWPRDAAIGFTLLASAFAAPSLWIYDWPLIAAGLFMLSRSSGPWPLPMQAAAGFLWVAPLIPLGAQSMISSLAPFFALTAMLLLLIGYGGAQGFGTLARRTAIGDQSK